MICFGDRDRLGRTGRRPADQSCATDYPLLSEQLSCRGVIGGTPMTATGTVAIPFSKSKSPQPTLTTEVE